MTLDVDFFFFTAIVCGYGGSSWWLVATMVGGCGSCGMGGWMWWLTVLISAGLRKKETETETERGRIKNDKERIFK